MLNVFNGYKTLFAKTYLGKGANAKRRDPRIVTEADLTKLYKRPPSFTDLLPYGEYCSESKTLHAHSSAACAIVFEFDPIKTEARTPEYLESMRTKFTNVLSSAIPEYSKNPWVLQLYARETINAENNYTDLHDYIRDVGMAYGTDLTADYLRSMHEHYRMTAKEGGLFHDEKVLDGPWRTKRYVVRAVLYRSHGRDISRLRQTPEDEVNKLYRQLEKGLAAEGIKVRRYEGKDIYEWLLKWFNPAPPLSSKNPDAILKVAPYPGDEAMSEVPVGSAFSELLTLSHPRSDPDAGVWWFNDKPHTCVTINTLTRPPAIGAMSAELPQDEEGRKSFALFDKLPEDTIMAMTIVFNSQDDMRRHLARIGKASGAGDSSEAEYANRDCKFADEEITKGNKLYSVNIAFYMSAETIPDLRNRVEDLYSYVGPAGLKPIFDDDDLFRVDSFIFNLPMCYDPERDKKKYRRSRLWFLRHISAVAPIYGRSHGTGHHGFSFFNRGGEVFSFDPLNRRDREKNAHMFIFGPTGAGKSATCVKLLRELLAVYNPRIYVIELGGSFNLFGDYCESMGKSVNRLEVRMGNEISLPPFFNAMKLLSEESVKNAVDPEQDPASFDAMMAAIEAMQTQAASNDETDDEEDKEQRDYLGEMEIAARLIITGGDPKENDKISRADRMTIRQSIIDATHAVAARGRHIVLTEDVASAMRALADNESIESRKERTRDMADAINLFCDKNSLEGQLFNTEGQRWPETDVTIFNLGELGKEGNEDKLNVAFVGLLNTINDIAERCQFDSRPTVVLIDECHLITMNPLLAPYIVKIVKMWRKLGAWLWMATQNIDDMHGSAAKMLNMMEWWICLVMEKDEVGKLKKYKAVTPEQEKMMISTRKQPGCYTEGVVLGPENAQGLFRNVAEPLVLALAQTEKDEKAARRVIMNEKQCTELEAAYEIARRMSEKRS